MTVILVHEDGLSGKLIYLKSGLFVCSVISKSLIVILLRKKRPVVVIILMNKTQYEVRIE